MIYSQPVYRRALIAAPGYDWLAEHAHKSTVCRDEALFNEIVFTAAVGMYDLIAAPVGWWPPRPENPWAGMGWRAVIAAMSASRTGTYSFIDDCRKSLRLCDTCIGADEAREVVVAKLGAVQRRVSNLDSRAVISPVVTALNGRVEVDTYQQTLRVDGREIGLAPSERFILMMLANNDRTVSKDELLESYAGTRVGDEPDMKIIDVFICRMRRKISIATGNTDCRAVIGATYGIGLYFDRDRRERAAEPASETSLIAAE